MISGFLVPHGPWIALSIALTVIVNAPRALGWWR